MASPSSAAQKHSRARRSITAIGPHDHAALKASGLYQTKTVHDRIKQWQAHGAASALAPDTLSILSMSRPEVVNGPSSVKSEDDCVKVDEKQSKGGHESSKASDSHKARTSRRIRSSSTPRKRVVSDEHWKTSRTTGNNKSTKPVNQNSISSRDGPSPPGSHIVRSSKEARAEREERRRRRVEARSQKPEEVKQRNNLHNQSRMSSQNSISNEIPRDHDDHTSPGKAKYSDNESTIVGRSLEFDVQRPDEDDDRPRRRSKYAETLGKSQVTFQDAQPKSKRGVFLSKTKEVLGISDPTPIISNRLPSIEAWLDEQPDPFTDKPSAKVRFVDDTSKNLKLRSSKRKSSPRNVTLADPNLIWNAIDNGIDNSDNETRSDKNKSSPAQFALSENPMESPSPVDLKRRGAKLFRSKHHSLPLTPRDVAQVLSETVFNGYKESSSSTTVNGQQNGLRTESTKVSTTVSVEPLYQQHQTVQESPGQNEHELKAKITTDEDMITVLSRPSLRRSARRKRNVAKDGSRPNIDPIKEVLENLAEEEAKYCRELRTLVDGVIPVLLQCVLSKSDAVTAAGLFTTSPNINNDLSFSRPIIDMGIALERLKSLHSRMPLHNIDSLFSWCQTAHKAYSDYLKAWRLGFQDVVINLAPLEGSEGENNEVMESDINGDIVNCEGETVDIAYLMKRPLVNIRKLGRVLNCLNEELKDHLVCEKIAEDYRELTAAAKTKHQQEKGRLEDEAAAHTDATKCRNIQDMTPLPDITIDKNKRVRARDCFNLTLFHSSGQRMDCKIELILRDNQQNCPDGGDLLICQIEETGKWLLFAPVDLSMVSARKGESGCDLVVMVRGRAGIGQEWRELLALQADEPEAISEWMLMLGSNPLPPKLSRVPSFIDIKIQTPVPVAKVVGPTESILQRVPSIEHIDIPIGEPSVLGIATSKEDGQQLLGKPSMIEKSTVTLNMGGGLQKKTIPEHWHARSSVTIQKPDPSSIQSTSRSMISDHSTSSVSTYCASSLVPMIPDLSRGSRAETKENLSQSPQSRYGPQVIPIPNEIATQQNQIPVPSIQCQVNEAVSDQISSQEQLSEMNGKVKIHLSKSDTISSEPVPLRTPSPMMFEALPKVQKVRGNSASNVPLTDAIRETWSTISGFGRKAVSQPSMPSSKETNPIDSSPKQRVSLHQEVVENDISSLMPGVAHNAQLPPPSQDKTIPALTPRSRNIPTLRPSEAQKKMDREKRRMSSSPLRKIYTPSSASTSEDSSSDPATSTDEDSETSADELQTEHNSRPSKIGSTPARRFSEVPIAQSNPAPTSGTRTLAPSDSASQGPYRRVPSSADRPNIAKKRAVAMICSWNDQGMWEPLVEKYCSIVVSPGLLEAFLMNEQNSNSADTSQYPLAAFELTPIVPLRRPTGLDINIRSPPTADSQIKTSNNIMFRSHSAAECEALYQMINWARCNNPTYIELERSRPRPQPAVTFSNQEAPRPRSWFSFGGGIRRRNSYRVGNIPPSSMGESQATANTTSSAMSALRRLTKSSSFNVHQSSVFRRSGGAADESIYSSSNGTGVDSVGHSPPPSQMGFIPGKHGPNVPATSTAALNGGGMVHNMRIRLQIRQDAGWVTMGFSRLTILPAVKHSSNSPEVSRPGSSGSNVAGSEEQSRRLSATTGPRLSSASYTPHRLHGGGREKRVVVTSEKDPSRVLLDATLGESCFEKISHLGIAIQVWKADDEVRSRGGVVLGQNIKYLFQFFHAKECAWVFELVGRYRYSAAIS